MIRTQSNHKPGSRSGRVNTTLLLTVQWDGSDGDGNPVASGVYLYRLEAGGFTQARKMVLLR